MIRKLLTTHIDHPECHTLKHYLSVGGYESSKKALNSLTPEQIINDVKTSGLRGRGGAGFPTGNKWSFIPKTDKPKYLICNADEGEPGTFKDRLLIEKLPHMLIEGMVIAAKAIDCHQGYIYIRGEFNKGIDVVETAVNEAYAAGLLGKNIQGSGHDFELAIYSGAGAYICGEESALINSLEGRRGHPRLKPPFPAVSGLYSCPTVVNNVETFCNVPHIIRMTGEEYKKIGTEKSPGTRLFAVSGHVKKPGIYEVEMGTPMKELIYDICGGMKNDKNLKAVIPGGSSAPILTAEEAMTATMDYESIASLKSMLGSGAVIIMSEEADLVETTYRLAEFYSHESCGQCTPCREGTHWVKDILHKIKVGEGTEKDVELIYSLSRNMEGGTTICPLADACVMAVRPTMQKFKEEFARRLQPVDKPTEPKKEVANVG
ncbi:NADH-quinone oxidoreductase subunit NuoF [Leptospira ilyithenensis]|uniref:NADH-quinone oxidoreductase subunit F n=1 Tax=Leptospira ilyithenensis TaxID=2484901 RepID=A0A4R9LT74_9LEPT|nr:NADH-quinone oxidoreductase subunit NuoF [Leptospira ilyithenensis]TGN11878.1 NADH oxidoreductase (quinone) subunit F [Leptospira ilyithenensis]